MSGREWLKTKIAESGNSKGSLILQIGITYKTLRSYVRGTTTPCIDPGQWMRFSKEIDISLEELMSLFSLGEPESPRLPAMNADQCLCIAKKLDMPVADFLSKLGSSD